MRTSTLRGALLAALAATATACVSVAHVENRRLAHAEPGVGYGARAIPSRAGSGLRVILAFSGGGTRAAALAYGVLEALRETEVVSDGREERLLDFVTHISSVSGGSFTAAYYGLHGDRIFEDFEERFLRRNIEARLILNLLRPFELLKLAITPYTRSDLAMDVYDEVLFDGATFADLAEAGGPLLDINATDIDVGTVFTFVQPHFDPICSDVSKIRISQAVTASSAVPGAFEPLRLRNFAGSCGYSQPAWVHRALANPMASRRRHREALLATTYLDAHKRPNVYLVDGGIADNIGGRRIVAEVIDAGGLVGWYDSQHIEIPSTLLYIVVNAQTAAKHGWVESEGGPGLVSILSSLVSIGMDHYDFETLELLRRAAADWSREASRRGHPLQTYVSELSFDQLEDPKERAFFRGIETSFDLDDETVDRLIEVGGRLLRQSPEFQSFLARWGAHR